MRDQLKKAFPATPDSFDQRMRSTLEHLPARRGRRTLKSAVAVALAAAIALCGLAFATSQSELLRELFGATSPTPQAQTLLTQLNMETTQDDVTLSIDEYLLDGADLYVRWTVTSQRQEALMLMVSDLETGLNAYPIGDSNLAELHFASGILLDAEHPSYSGTSRIHFEGRAPEDLFDVSFTAVLLKPLAPIVDDDEAGTFSGTPTLLRSEFDGAIHLSAVSEREECGEDCYGMQSDLDFSGDSSVDGMLDQIERAGYAQEVLRIPVRFTVAPDEAHIVHTEVEGTKTFSFVPFVIVIDSADFTAAGVNIRYTIIPRDSDDPWTSLASKLWFEVLPNGKTTDNAFMQSKTSVGRRIQGEIVARADSSIPDWVRLVPYDEETGQTLPQYAVEFRLKQR